jgi:hypothetical protein
MQVTPIGWILLIAGPLLMLLRPRWLYVVTVFFLPFTATAVLNVGSGLNVSGVQASLYLGSLLMLRYAALILWKMSVPIPRNGRVALFWLAIFIGITAISLVMPWWLEGKVMVPSPFLLDTSVEALHLKSSNITGVLYMIFGFGFTYLVAALNQKPEMIRTTLKAFLAGSAFASLWGILQLTLQVSHIPYPAFIFNTSESRSALGYLEQTGTFYRLSSVSVEPSIFAQTLLVAISLTLPFVFGTPRLFGKIADRCIFWLFVVVLCLTTSSTAYIGIPMIGLTILGLFAVRGILRPRYFIGPLAGLTAGILLYASVPIVRQVLDTMLFAKSASYSTLERLMTISNSYQMFLQHPLLGIGWMSITSHDLIVNILANAGIMGLITFSAAMYVIFGALYRSIQSQDKSLRVSGLMRMDFALYVALAVTLATSAISGFLNVFGFFWFVCGLAIATSSSSGCPLPSSQQNARLPHEAKALAARLATTTRHT